ncbi:hypothetical protein HPB47_022009 [Ixodes persulcatus]|uniref:Uncharacterized protein n=1 Tax=Ixodes persulcatus TaxID=34615 RepID=A0AC60QBW9_IXOPE|nr:hypothetical protein HPB47_022009 [Ixodes persulcatus]
MEKTLDSHARQYERPAQAQTSNHIKVNLQCDGATFTDPRFPDIYMVIYNIRPECFAFSLSFSKSWPAKDGVKFKNAIQKALTELKDCLTRSC